MFAHSNEKNVVHLSILVLGILEVLPAFCTESNVTEQNPFVH